MFNVNVNPDTKTTQLKLEEIPYDTQSDLNDIQELRLEVIYINSYVPTMAEQCNLSEEDFELFAAIVNAEDGFDNFDCQVANACVILNRVDDEDFNNTVRTVISESGQFSTWKHDRPVFADGSDAYATDMSRIAVYTAYTQRPLPKDVVFFRSGYYFPNLKHYGHIGDNYYSYK